MDDGVENDDELVETIYQGEIIPTLGSRTRTEFRPWHKPRKHYVRLNQWCHETRRLIKRLNLGTGTELRYLGLPGEDLLDIRVLKGVCQRASIDLRYLGFDSSMTSAQLNLSRHEVNSDKFIHPSSIVIADRLETLATRETIAFNYVERHAPFDIINLDLCDSVTETNAQGARPYFEAIRTLCDVQIQRRGQPWLLFLTTRALRDSLDGPTRQRLFQRLLQNIEENTAFSDSLSTTLQLNETAIKAECHVGGTLDASKWLQAFVLALSKWLLHYMMQKEYRVVVRLLPSYAYSVQHGKRDLASLAFLFEPTALQREDDSGLTRSRSLPTPAESEMSLAKELIAQVAAMDDIDDLFAANKKLKMQMFTKSVSLLAPLRYDMAAFKTFAFED